MAELKKRKQAVKEAPKKTKLTVPSGSTVLNLACTDSASGAFPVGKMVNVIGDSHSGKTLMALTMIAELANSEQFKDYRLIYDDSEYASEFDVEYLFGKETAKRMEPPKKPDNENFWPSSNTVEEFYGNVLNVIEDNQPFIYVLDSLDSLSSISEQERGHDYQKHTTNGTDLKGSYKMDKAKTLSEMLRGIVQKIQHSKSLVFIISQTRDKIDPMSFSKKTRSGGRALKFYCTFEIWLAAAKKIKKKERVIGSVVKFKVTKNKITGKNREGAFEVYYDYGVDDIGSCIDFLLAEKVFEKKGTKIETHGEIISELVTKDKLVRHIEDNNLEPALKKIVEAEWIRIEESLKLNRKKRF